MELSKHGGLYKQRRNIFGIITRVILLALTMRFSAIENAKIVCLESSDVRLIMIESTILFMFNLDALK